MSVHKGPESYIMDLPSVFLKDPVSGSIKDLPFVFIKKLPSVEKVLALFVHKQLLRSRRPWSQKQVTEILFAINQELSEVLSFSFKASSRSEYSLACVRL